MATNLLGSSHRPGAGGFPPTTAERIQFMKEYETVWEIFNKCPNNQMRDVFIDEVRTDDPEEFIRNKFKDKVFTLSLIHI